MKLKIGKTEIEIFSSSTPEEKKQNLKNVYDTINKIADKQRSIGKNVDSWFYTPEEIEQLKVNNDPRLIY